MVKFPRSLIEQSNIIDRINNVYKTTKELEKIYGNKISCCIDLKKSILQQAFNGELDGVKG